MEHADRRASGIVFEQRPVHRSYGRHDPRLFVAVNDGTAQITQSDTFKISLVPGAGLEPAWGCPRGIFLPLQLSLLHTQGSRAFVVWTLPLPCRSPAGGRVRQGPSSLYTFPAECAALRWA